MSKYLCWNCGLWQGDEQDDLESSKLCPACTKARNATVHQWEQSVRDTVEERRVDHLELLHGTATPVYRPEEGTE